MPGSSMLPGRAEARPVAATSVGARAGSAWIPFCLLLAIVACGTALRVYNFHPGLARTPDERTYTRQADIVLVHGAEGFRALGRELTANLPEVSLYPSPLRVGYISLLAAWMRLTGDDGAVAGARLSLLCSLISLVLIAAAGWRFLSPTVAVVAALFFAVSPFNLTVSRRTWQEACIDLVTLVTLFVANQIGVSGRRSRVRGLALAFFCVLGLLALTAKENAGVAFLLCAGGLAVHQYRGHDRRGATLTVGSAAMAVLAYAAVLSWLFGGVEHAFALVRACARVSATNPYDLQYDAGPPWMFAAGLLRVSPFVCVAGLAGAAATLRAGSRSSPRKRAALGLGITLLTAGMLLTQVAVHRYSLRYTAPIDGAACLLAGIGVEAVLVPLRRGLAPLGSVAGWGLLSFALLVAAWRDFDFAQRTLIRTEAPDLALRPILGLPPAQLSVPVSPLPRPE